MRGPTKLSLKRKKTTITHIGKKDDKVLTINKTPLVQNTFPSEFQRDEEERETDTGSSLAGSPAVAHGTDESNGFLNKIRLERYNL